jgi:thiol-disulfide isomerase/thioredoxin
LRVLFNPRFWLILWAGLGVAALVYVILAASLSGGASMVETAMGRPFRDSSLLVGEMADFTYATAPRTAPDEPFVRAGGEGSLADFRGRTVLVNFWATWCAPCVKELPSLDALQRAFRNEEFAVVAVAADATGPEAARAFLDRLGLEALDLYADPTLKLAIAAGGSAALPLSILYDRRGREIGRIVGEADWAAPESKALIRAAIAFDAR